MENLAKNNIFAISRAVTRSTVKPLIYALILDGIAVNDLSYVIGYFAVKDSPDQTNSRGTGERIREKNVSCVQNATKSS